mmetsp:Transcript_18070/g.37866  ORF Transcript_18070/g.37866 Transcript_18070/m.37866 type:complete len:528 (+) Transcript_18070:109-1692(+)
MFQTVYSMRVNSYRHCFHRSAAPLSTRGVFGGDKIIFCSPNVNPPIGTGEQKKCRVFSTTSYSLRGRIMPRAFIQSTSLVCTYLATAPRSTPFSNSPKRKSSIIPNASLTKTEIETVEQLSNDIIDPNSTSEEGENENILSEQMMRRRIALSKAITLVESKSANRRLMGDILLDRLRQSTRNKVKPKDKKCRVPFRLGIAGPPGAGKSTFVEALGLYILGLKENSSTSDLTVEVNNLSQNSTPRTESTSVFAPEKLAVLCIDPSSQVTGGSILGDKTRMSNLSHHPRAYVRPSPSSGTLGGLGSYTHDAVSLCEMAGYDLTIVETVGVGQSEVELAECVDMFLLLLAPGGGDELQGSKKGIVEVADVLVVNKADGEYEKVAKKTASEYKKAMGLLRKPVGWWGKKSSESDGCSKENGAIDCAPAAPPVLLISAKTGFGLEELWQTISKYREFTNSSGNVIEKRKKQNRYWMWKYLRERVLETAKNNPRVKSRADDIEKCLDEGLMAPRVAAGELWKSIVYQGDEKSE